MPSSRARTQGERVYAALRADILTGRQPPATRLPFGELTARYGASMGVVREALSRLTAEGLVQAQAQQGFRVMPLSIDDLRHLTDARSVIETFVLKEAVTHGGVGWESQVVATHHRLERTEQMDSDDPDRLSDDWAAAHSEYHRTLLAGCPNPRLRAVAASLRDSAELYRRWSVPFAHEHRDIASEHRAIVGAVLSHDGDAAAALLALHIRHTSRVLIDQAAADADPTAGSGHENAEGTSIIA